jgi:hypothetical protein
MCEDECTLGPMSASVVVSCAGEGRLVVAEEEEGPLCVGRENEGAAANPARINEGGEKENVDVDAAEVLLLLLLLLLCFGLRNGELFFGFGER